MTTDLPLYIDGSVFILWSHDPRQPWQNKAYYDQQRSTLRPETYRRLHKNEWVQRESTFVDIEYWDRCVDPTIQRWHKGDESVLVLGLDASKSKDCTALIACSYLADLDLVIIKHHRIWEPIPLEITGGRKVVDLDATIKNEVLTLVEQGAHLEAIYYDPFQLHSIAISLLRQGLNMIEFPQGDQRILADQHLYDRITSNTLRMYQALDLREHVRNAVAVERPQGLRIIKVKQEAKVDGAVALSMAAYGAVQWLGQEVEAEVVGAMF